MNQLQQHLYICFGDHTDKDWNVYFHQLLEPKKLNELVMQKLLLWYEIDWYFNLPSVEFDWAVFYHAT